MPGSDEESVPYSIVMVNHQDGGVFAYSTPCKGVQVDSNWVPERLAKDIDNCGTSDVSVQIKSD